MRDIQTDGAPMTAAAPASSQTTTAAGKFHGRLASKQSFLQGVGRRGKPAKMPFFSDFFLTYPAVGGFNRRTSRKTSFRPPPGPETGANARQRDAPRAQK